MEKSNYKKMKKIGMINYGFNSTEASNRIRSYFIKHGCFTNEQNDEVFKTMISKKKEGFDIEREREKIVNGNLGLVYSIASLYSNSTGKCIDDLISEGVIGLMDAIERYSVEKSDKSSFATYSQMWIRKRILEFMDYDTIVRYPSDSVRNRKKASEYMESYFAKNGIYPDVEDVVEFIESSTGRCVIPEHIIDADAISIESSFSDNNNPDEESSDSSSLISMMWGGVDKNYYENDIEKEDNAYTVNLLLKHIPLKNRKIIEMFFGINGYDQMSSFVIAMETGIGKSSIEKIIRESLKEMSKHSN